MKKIVVLFLLVLTFGFVTACVGSGTRIKYETFGGSLVQQQVVEEGMLPTKPEDPTKEGFVFAGWYSDKKYTVEFKFDEPLTKSITVYAKWEELQLPTYTVTFKDGEGNVLSTESVKEGKLATSVDAPSKTGEKFIGWFEDVTSDTKFDFNTPITKDIELTCKYNENVRTAVYSVAERSEFSLFNTNRSTKVNKRTEFMDLTVPYHVGDDNNFLLKPQVRFIIVDADTLEVIDRDAKVDEWHYDISITVDGSSDVSQYVDSIDNINCSVDFSEQAIGKTFRIVVTPELTEKQLARVEEYQTSIEVLVVDGYNVYDVKELGYIDSRKELGGREKEINNAWIAFKEANGLSTTLRPNGIILHKNMIITTEDIPGYFFYTLEEVKGASDEARAVGSRKDDYDIYKRDLTAGEKFDFYGNYFKFDTSSLPVVVREQGRITEEGKVVSHSTVIRFNDISRTDNVNYVNFNSINFVGNAPRVENALKAGGDILVKAKHTTFNSYNTITVSYFIAFMGEDGYEPVTLEKMKAYDSYNCFIYGWGSNDMHLIDSELSGAGGPALILDHLRPGKSNEVRTNIEIVNSKIDSYVTGNEGWFKGYGADAVVPSIKGSDLALNPFGKSILKANESATFLNFIAVYKSSEVQGMSAEKVEGSVTIKANETETGEVFDFGADDPILKALLDSTMSMGTIGYQSGADGIAYFGGANVGLVDSTNTPITDPAHLVFSGDHISLYYNGMMILFALNDYNGAYEFYTPSY